MEGTIPAAFTDLVYEGEIASGSGSTAMALDSGLTNDATPTIEIALDRDLVAGETLTVYRTVLVNGVEGAKEVAYTTTSTTGAAISFDDDLGETYGQDYRYSVEVIPASGEAYDAVKTDDATTVVTHDIRLDTIVESAKVTEASLSDLNGQPVINSVTFEAGDEQYTTVLYKWGNMTEMLSADITGQTSFTINTPGFDARNPTGLQVQLVDAAGNISDITRVVFGRNLQVDVNDTTGPNMQVGGTAEEQYGGYYDKYPSGTIESWKQQSSTNATEAFMSTDQNDVLILGLDNFFPVTDNGSIRKQDATQSPSIQMGAGDDMIQARNILGAPNSATVPVTIDMGTGNDVISVQTLSGASLAQRGNIAVNTGEGHDIFEVQNTVNSTTGLTLDMGAGNDLMRIRNNLDGKHNITMGDGDDTLEVGGYISGNFLNNDVIIDFGEGDNTMFVGSNVDSKTVGYNHSYTFGSGNDTVYIGGNVVGDNHTYNLGDGDNNMTVIGAIQNTVAIQSGAGNDTFTFTEFGSAINQAPTLDAGAGSDTVIIKDQLGYGSIYVNENKARINGGEGEDTLVFEKANGAFSSITFAGFETIDLTATGEQTVNLRISDLVSDTSVNEIMIKGGTDDYVNLGQAGIASTSGSKDNPDLTDNSTDPTSTWSKALAETNGFAATKTDADGVVYELWTNSSDTENAVYIQQGIQVI
ncbi:hypothetical protein [Moraxella porci]|uniref:hypothetical protein n=1 Tax=Moraxella porci TaxID=1288392 RepID=UPI0024498310|nr:hypothetical protein [Moraxella porci]MDH2273602.1 hypothetical protein [Moraxella porci]